MENKIIVYPSNFLEKIRNNEAKIYLFKPGTYELNETLVLSKKVMLTALDENDKPNIVINKSDKRPAIHIINEPCYIHKLKFIDKSMSNDIIRNDSANTKIMNNDFTGCKTAIISGGDDTVIKKNLIEQFTQDGIQFSGQRTKVQENLIQDLIQLPSDDAHHHDAIQAWAGDPESPLNATDRYLAKYELADAEITGNIIISTTDMNRDYQGALQGITAFDGWMSGWIINNNFINTHSTIHGITILGAINSDNNRFRVYNNEVFSQRGEIDDAPEIHIKPARCWDGKIWKNIEQLSFNTEINRVIDYDITDKNNTCNVHRHYCTKA